MTDDTLLASHIGSASSPGQLLYERSALAGPSSPRHKSSSPASKGSRSRTGKILRRTTYHSEEGEEEEIAWWGRTVVWSKGTEIHQQYTFEEGGDAEEKVMWAGFVWFPPQGFSSLPESRSSVRSSRTDSVTDGPNQPPRPGREELFGPFHASQHYIWGQPAPPIAGRHPPQLVRTLVVCRKEQGTAYFPSGDDFKFHLPFVVDSAFPLPSSMGGILLQRSLTRAEQRKISKTRSDEGYSDPRHLSLVEALERNHGPSDPKVYTLMNPFHEAAKVIEASVIDGKVIEEGGPLEYTDNILFSAEDPYPFVIAHDQQENELVFYTRHKAPVIDLPTQSSTRFLRPEDLLAAPTKSPAEVPRPSLQRAGSGFVNGDRRISTLQAEAMDRTRGGPRISRGGKIDAQQSATEHGSRPSNGTAELQAALDPFSLPPSASSQITNSRLSSKGKSRASALGEGSLILEENPRHGLLGTTEVDLRETTMMMGLDRNSSALRSEIVLERLYTWKAPDGINLSSVKIFLTNNTSPNSTHINIHSSGMLFAFRARLGKHWDIEPFSSTSCTSALRILSTHRKVYDTIYLQDGSLRVLTSTSRHIFISLPRNLLDGRVELPHQLASTLRMGPSIDGITNGHRARRITNLTDAFGQCVSVHFDDGETLRLKVNHTIDDTLFQQCVEAIACLLPEPAVFALKRHLCSIIQASDAFHRRDVASTWEAFVQVIRSVLVIPPYPCPAEISQEGSSGCAITARLAARARSKRSGVVSSAQSTGPESRPLSRTPDFDSGSLTAILIALHLVAEDCRLSQSRQEDLKRISGLVLELCAASGEEGWYDYWMRLMPLSGPAMHVESVTELDRSLLEGFESPPDIITYLGRRLVTPLSPFASLQAKTAFFDISRANCCPAITLILAIYEHLCVTAGSATTPQAKADNLMLRGGALVTFMLSKGLGYEYIQDLPAGVAVPIMEMLRVCQAAPSKDWSPEVYDFIGRADLAAQARGVRLESRDKNEILDDETPTVGNIMASVEKDFAKHAHLLPAMPHVRFGSDKRLEEVERIMQTTKIRTIETRAPSGISDTDLPQYQQSEVNTIANRTLSVLVGQGIFNYGTRTASITDVADIPLIELSVKVVPGSTTLQAQIAPENADWPCFHNGVAAGLAVSPDSKGVDSSWIVFNRPTALNPEHGGFLLGLGLTGHLRSLATYHAFPYMEPRHDFTSVGLLLGLASSFAGSEDILITKVLSLHTHALLPQGSMELNASALIQSTALVGVGLVHAGSRNLRMAELVLGQLGKSNIPGVDGFKDYTEAYSFSAAMSFGLIMLGRGGKSTSPADERIMKALKKCIIREPQSLHGRNSDTSAIDINIAGPGATLALGLMFLKTNRKDVADILHVPTTTYELENVRPDLLLIRTFARALIMWDEIDPTMRWVESVLPGFMAYRDHKNTSSMEHHTELAYLSIVAGACLAIGLKYAGTAAETAHTTLTTFCNVLSKATAGPNTYEANIRRVAARQGLGIATIALTVVMSGTGELNALRRIRMAHGQEGLGVNYGTHMAQHMALGILFLGKGYYTLGSSNLAIAAMAISFFPRFLPSAGDNTAYPQAFRHLWALAVEPRCLIARDVDTRETIYLPVKIKLKDGDQERYQSLISPTLIAPFETLLTIEVDSPRYWPITYDLSNPRDRRALINTRTIHVKRKSAFLDYNSDPKGNRSIYIRAGSMTGLDLHYDLVSPAAPPSIEPEELVELVRSHSGEPSLIALAEHLKGESRFEKAVRIILLECITLDKQAMIPIYISLLLALKDNPTSEGTMIEMVTQLEFIRRFYDGIHERHYALPSRERQIPLLRTGFISALSRRLKDVEPEDSVKEAYWREGQWVVGDRAGALALYLNKNNVPARECLRLLGNKVAETRGGGSVHMRVRDSAREYQQAMESQWDAHPLSDEVEEGLWKLASMEEAIRSWQ